ncbi:internal scaffolding protein [Sigmofec virus UA08Rod_5433]|uniref:Internal scaffolding protein n=1 Tax=Sigmofec virus UA08Rod_5433 TaxID=2929424 RepID=A0A976R804_9VIRU|nr:internal scaffolding protein [Sigmofec virus UA08Rod_5433]
MAKFRTQYDTFDKPFSEPGSPIKTLYGPIFNENGVMSLKEIGKHDLYSEIQSHADSVDIHVLLKMYEQGDTSVFSRIQGAYGDFTSMPTTFAEALNTMIAAEQYFNSLPVEIKAKFGHSFSQFLAGMDSPTWASDAGIIPPDIPTPGPVPSSETPAPPPEPSPSPAPPPSPAPAP